MLECHQQLGFLSEMQTLKNVNMVANTKKTYDKEEYEFSKTCAENLTYKKKSYVLILKKKITQLVSFYFIKYLIFF